MDLKTILAVFADGCTLSANCRLVMIALAYRKFNVHSECRATVGQLVRLCRLSKSTVLRAIKELSTCGAVKVEHSGKGGASVYQLCLDCGGSFGVTETPNNPAFGVTETPNNHPLVSQRHQTTPHLVSQRHPFGVTETPNNAPYKEYNNISVCAISDGTHTQFDVDKLSADLGIPKPFVESTFATWERTGWHTTKGVAIDEQNIKPMLNAFWENERDKETYTESKKPQRTFTAKDWELCKEDKCANYKQGGGCRCGIQEPPAHNTNWKHRPINCKRYVAIATDKGAVA